MQPKRVRAFQVGMRAAFVLIASACFVLLHMAFLTHCAQLTMTLDDRDSDKLSLISMLAQQAVSHTRAARVK